MSLVNREFLGLKVWMWAAIVLIAALFIRSWWAFVLPFPAYKNLADRLRSKVKTYRGVAEEILEAPLGEGTRFSEEELAGIDDAGKSSKEGVESKQDDDTPFME